MSDVDVGAVWLFSMEDPGFNVAYDDALARLLAGPALHWTEEAGGYWLAARYADVRACAIDWETFSSSERGIFLRPHEGVRKQVLEEQDPPAHTRWRRVVSGFFTPAAVVRLEPAIREIADDLIDGFVEAGRCDIAIELSAPLPGLVFFREVLGIPVADLAVLRRTAHAALHAPVDQRAAGWEALNAYVAAYLRRRLDEPPRDDVVSAVLGARFDGEPAEWDEQVSCVTTLLAGGLNTTSGAITAAVSHFARHPEHRRLALDHHEVLEQAIEEVLRLSNPAFAIGRTATRDTTVGGCPVRAGERVFIAYGAACQDPARFDEPRSFRLGREGNAHLAFGAGPHRCLGAPLVRLEMRVVLDIVLRRLPGLRLAGEPAFTTGQLRHIDSLPVAFDTVEQPR